MMPYLELRSAARNAGVPASTIERDYIQNWFLAGLKWDIIALKGGTAIRKAFIPDYRFSDDLDFTLTDEAGIGEVRALVDGAVKYSQAEIGIVFEEAKKMSEVENGFMMALRSRMEGSPYDSLKLKLDFTKSGNEKIIAPLETRPLLHGYPDKCVASLRTYSLNEMAAEKVRSLFQRTRARDLYDVWYLFSHGLVKESDIRDPLGKKFRLKKIEMDIERLKARGPDYRKAWDGSLGHQMKEVPDFGPVFDWVVSAVSGFDIRA